MGNPNNDARKNHARAESRIANRRAQNLTPNPPPGWEDASELDIESPALIYKKTIKVPEELELVGIPSSNGVIELETGTHTLEIQFCKGSYLGPNSVSAYISNMPDDFIVHRPNSTPEDLPSVAEEAETILTQYDVIV